MSGRRDVSVLVIDVGTSSMRAAIVDQDGSVVTTERSTISAQQAGAGSFRVRRGGGGPSRYLGCDNVDRSNRTRRVRRDRRPAGASTVVWQRRDGVPVGPAISRQDVRTVGRCLALQAKGFRLSPNQSATKLADLLDRFDPSRELDLCFGTVESFLTAGSHAVERARH